MPATITKRIGQFLPRRLRRVLREIRYEYQIRRRKFVSPESEYKLIDRLVKSGDCVLDIGANVGHYTVKLSRLVGPDGRVIALEPSPDTFEYLTRNVGLLPVQNVTLLNVAASDASNILRLDIPSNESGIPNYYLARLTEKTGGLRVVCIAVDALNLTQRISLIKIDAEGHDNSVLEGLDQLLQRYHPVLIVESVNAKTKARLHELGYQSTRLDRSPNIMFHIGLLPE